MNTCDHCEAVRRVQQGLAWGGQPMTGRMHFPDRYWDQRPGPNRYDGDPGPCPCRCHDTWRLWCRLVGP